MSAEEKNAAIAKILTIREQGEASRTPAGMQIDSGSHNNHIIGRNNKKGQ